MKKPIIFSVLFLIITAISSFGEWISKNKDEVSGLYTGEYVLVNPLDPFDPTSNDFYSFRPNANLSGKYIRNWGNELKSFDLRGPRTPTDPLPL